MFVSDLEIKEMTTYTTKGFSFYTTPARGDSLSLSLSLSLSNKFSDPDKCRDKLNYFPSRFRNFIAHGFPRAFHRHIWTAILRVRATITHVMETITRMMMAITRVMKTIIRVMMAITRVMETIIRVMMAIKRVMETITRVMKTLIPQNSPVLSVKAQNPSNFRIFK